MGYGRDQIKFVVKRKAQSHSNNALQMITFLHIIGILQVGVRLGIAVSKRLSRSRNYNKESL